MEMTAQGGLACGDDCTGRSSRVEMTARGGLAVCRRLQGGLAVCRRMHRAA